MLVVNDIGATVVILIYESVHSVVGEEARADLELVVVLLANLHDRFAFDDDGEVVAVDATFVEEHVVVLFVIVQVAFLPDEIRISQERFQQLRVDEFTAKRLHSLMAETRVRVS